jgi:hypothetical protein
MATDPKPTTPVTPAKPVKPGQAQPDFGGFADRPDNAKTKPTDDAA